MIKWILVIGCLVLGGIAQAQPTEITPSGPELFDAAKKYVQQADYANAIMVFNQAIQAEPRNLVYRRELSFTYYLQGDMMRAEAMVKPLLKAEEADPETFLVASKVYTRMKSLETAREVIQSGLQKFPKEGSLYEEKGQVLTVQKNYKAAAEAWEDGVRMAPGYHLNYYNLSKTYFFNKKYVWAIVYGEHYVNLEKFASKTEEIKKVMYESYKFLIAELNNVEIRKTKKAKEDDPETFEECYTNTIRNLKNVVTGGITPENLTMLRVRFLLDWNRIYAKTFPLELIDFHHRLNVAGLFDSYNIWLFGRADDEKKLTAWTQKNAALMNQFDSYFRSHPLIPQHDQYYQN
jgi:tetratricopeptide (TPR) repeat protein